ncbi:MAG: hypothetical protein Kow00108_13350 [Calditrichia bacterium]
MDLSRVWRNTLIYSLILIGTVGAQTNSFREIWLKFIDGETDSLIIDAAHVSDKQNPYYLTLKGLVSENGHHAFGYYEAALKYCQDPALKEFLLDKIVDYYYAQGLYRTAEKYKSQYSNSAVTPEYDKSSDIYLQFGVFSTEQNAKKFIDQNFNSNIQFKLLNLAGKYYVVTGPYFDRQEAVNEKNRIKNTTRLKPFVKKF